MRVGIWVRVSTQFQAGTDSPLHHKLRAEEYCTFKDHQIITYYDLSGVSGADVDQHPEFRRMMQDIESGHIQGIVFSKLARLARSTSMLLQIADHFKKYNATLISLDEEIDTGSSMGKVFFTLLAAFAEFERDQIRERVQASVVTRAKLGKRLGGNPPFGYCWVRESDSDTARIEIEPGEAAVVQRIYREFLEKQKIKAVASGLDGAGLRTRGGKEWVDIDHKIKRILTDKVYIGKYKRNYTRRTKKGDTDRLKPESEWVTIDINPIIDEQTFSEVQKVLEARAVRYSNAVPKTGSYLFSGIMKCSCGEKMYVNAYKSMREPRYSCRKCKLKVWESDVLAGVMGYVKNIAVSPEMLQLRQNDNDIAQLENQKENAEKELGKVKKALDRYFELFAEGVIKSQNELADKQATRKARETQLSAEIIRLSNKIIILENEDLARETLVKQAIRLGEMWDDFTYEERARLLQSIVSEVNVSAAGVKIMVCAMPALFQENMSEADHGKSMERGTHTQGLRAETSMTRAG